MKSITCLALALSGATVLSGADPVVPAAPDELPPPQLTEFWSPVPPVIRAPAGQPPSDAIILFDGNGLAAWESEKEPGRPAPWRVEDGALIPVEKSGDIRTKTGFGDIQLHLEYRYAADIRGASQLRGNSGVFFMGLYELQVVDSYENPTYVNGQAASIYKQHPPLVNAARPPGEWQTYDAVWTAPRFAPDGRLLQPARLTVFHNGVLVHHHAVLRGPTVYRGSPSYRAHPARLPLKLQEHRNDSKDPLSFRNIWVRELPPPEPAG